MPHHPNVVVLLTDQQRWDTAGIHGNPLGLTENLDRMASEGVHLTHSFTCQPVCGPSRAALQTGRYPTRNGCYRNGIPLREEETTLAKLFSGAGYRTAYIGKWHLADVSVAGPVRPEQRGGYDYWMAANLLEYTSDAYRTTLYDGDDVPHEFEGYRADAVVGAAIDFLGQQHEEPFFCFISLLEPHHQNDRDDYPAPDGYRERYQDTWVPEDLAALGGNSGEHLGGYLGMVKRVDECLGRLREALSDLGLADDTIVMFSSDHGCHFKTRNREYKRSCHDVSLRVPTVLCGPGLDGGIAIRRSVSHIELAPTLLDAAGIGVPEDLDGRSLMPLVRGEVPDDGEDPRLNEVFVQISESEVGRALRTPRWKYAITAPQADAWWDSASDRYEDAYLYDLEADPYELDNLIGREGYDAVVLGLRERLLARMVEAGERRPEVSPARMPA